MEQAQAMLADFPDGECRLGLAELMFPSEVAPAGSMSCRGSDRNNMTPKIIAGFLKLSQMTGNPGTLIGWSSVCRAPVKPPLTPEQLLTIHLPKLS